eukprot:CCRYP_008540-RA/>CCRYP_008540-RA protein AED:0.42 eAED:0.60 QI:0/0/0/1/0/0/2/0/100
MLNNSVVSRHGPVLQRHLARRSEILAPLTNLGYQNKEKPWHWDAIHQQAFDTVKATIAADVTLAYPDYSQGFGIYTDSSKFQLGAVITQNNRRWRSSAEN